MDEEVAADDEEKEWDVERTYSAQRSIERLPSDDDSVTPR